MYYLDTNTCIFFLKGRYRRIRDRVLSTAPGDVAIPSIVKAELVLGAYKSASRDRTLEAVESFLQPFEIIPFTDQMNYHYADIRSDLERKGLPFGPHDLLIAAMVRYHDGTLVTGNVSEFGRVEGLRVENWAMEDPR